MTDQRDAHQGLGERARGDATPAGKWIRFWQWLDVWLQASHNIPRRNVLASSTLVSLLLIAFGYTFLSFAAVVVEFIPQEVKPIAVSAKPQAQGGTGQTESTNPQLQGGTAQTESANAQPQAGTPQNQNANPEPQGGTGQTESANPQPERGNSQPQNTNPQAGSTDPQRKSAEASRQEGKSPTKSAKRNAFGLLFGANPLSWIATGAAVYLVLLVAVVFCYLLVRKSLLETRRLRFLSGHSSYGGSFVVYIVLSFVFVAAATWLYIKAPVEAGSIDTPWLIHLCVALFALALSVFVNHVVEYHLIASMFSSLEGWSLPRAIRATTEAQRERLRLLETHQFLRGDPAGIDLDFLPDREQSITAMVAMAKRLGEQLKQLTERNSDDLIFAECDGVVRFITYHRAADLSPFDGTGGRKLKPKMIMLVSEAKAAQALHAPAATQIAVVPANEQQAPQPAPAEATAAARHAAEVSDEQANRSAAVHAIQLAIPRGGFARRAAYTIPPDVSETEAKDRNNDRVERDVVVTCRTEVHDGQRVSAGEVLVRIGRENISKELRDVRMNDLLESYGNVAALFHPDYLPHLSHTYLKLSQMRALNMPPRRIQLLGRQWTQRGLESEYVVAHDVSEIRSDYSERIMQELDRDAITLASMASARGAPTDPDATRVIRGLTKADMKAQNEGKQGGDDNNKGTEGKERERPPIKWRARPLKKRARVVVAPDGSLVRIAIEEERQFNI